MNRRNNNSEITALAAWARRAADVAAILGLGLGLAVAVFAQSPTGTSPSGTGSPITDVPLAYSWPGFHAGGTTPNFVTPLLPLPGEPLVPYGQLQGTPSGLFTIPAVAATGGEPFTQATGTAVTTQIPSRLLGNYLPTAPPQGLLAGGQLAYFPNHFRDGGTPPFLQIVGPFGYTYPNPLTGTYPQVQSSPAAVNVTEYPVLTSASYYGVVANPLNTPNGTTQSPSAPDTTKFGANSTDPVHQIRQVVYFGRTETVNVTATANGNEAGGVAVPAGIPLGTPIQVGAVYAMDGFTGGIIWRYQVPSFRATSVSTVPSVFAATTTGTAHSDTGNGPQPFQIGPTINGVGSTTDTAINNGAPGTLTVTSVGNQGGLPTTTEKFTLYAAQDTPLNATQVRYTGTYALYQPGATTATDSTGTFSATATFTSATAANVTGTFTAVSGATAYSPATFSGTFTSGANGTNQQLTGTLTQAVQTGFTAATTGTVNSVSGNGPQAFQVGPTINGVGSANAAINGGAPGTLTVTSAPGNLGGLSTANENFTLYAQYANALSATQVLYTGTYAIYLPGATTATESTGTFSATATFTTPYAATVTGTFTATTGATAYSPATFNGTFTSGANGTNQQLTGNLTQTLGAQTFGTPQVYSSPVVSQFKVTPPGGGTPVLKTVVVIADNNGFVYCLDAVGNGDGSSNSNIYPANQPATGTQTGIAYDEATATAENLPLDPSGVHAHAGTTFPYWVYRPDPNQPKYVSGTNVGTVKPLSAFDPKSDLPVPASFGTASASVYVTPPTTVPATAAGFATIYIGNSNGVLYALDGTGVSSAATATAPNADPYNNPLTGLPGVADATNTPKPLWWFSTGGAGPDTNPTNSITSAPAVYLDPNNGFNPVVYIGTSSILGNNTGRLYAVDGINGPRGNNGETDPTVTTSTSNNFGIPGSPDYNVNPRPYWAFPDQYGHDFVTRLNPIPAGYESWSTSGVLRPSVGDITGSPVVFNNPHDGSTRIYFAANAGTEIRTEGGTFANGVVTNGTPTTFQANQDQNFGRIWGINTNGSASIATGTTGTETAVPNWVYPSANNPNVATLDGTAEPSQPLGGFLDATPAMGLVEFPKTITQGNNVAWAHSDHGGAGGVARTMTFDGTGTAQSHQVAMLYVGTYTPNDAAFYELDVDGTNASGTPATIDSERNIYRLVSPNGAGFQSSPALVTNSSVSGGNGGAVFLSAANTLYQFQATPISNPTAGQAFPFINATGDQSFSGAGPISSPAIAAANVTNLPGAAGTQNSDTVRDWVYIADDTLSLCRGFTPDQQSNGQPEEYLPLPPVPDQVASTSASGQFPLRAYLFDGSTTPPVHPGTSTDMSQANQIGQTLPVFDWGQAAYIRIANVVPPAGAVDASGNPALVIDPNNNLVAYGQGGPVTFQLEDSNSKAVGATLQVPAVAPTPATPNTIDINQNGFYLRTDNGTTHAVTPQAPDTTAPGDTVALTTTGDNTGFGWVAAYTYHVAFADGSLLANTPGAQRRLINVSQRATEYTRTSPTAAFTVSNPAVLTTDTMPTGDFLPPTPNTTAGGYNANNPPANGLGTAIVIDQPTFGILNPLAVRGGGLPLGATTGAAAQPLGGFTGGGNLVDGIGPFRAVDPALPPGSYDLQALANGNLVYTGAAPLNGSNTATTDPTQGTVTLNAQAAAMPQAVLNVATATPQILDGSQGDNTDPSSTGIAVGNYGGGTGSGLSSPAFGSAMLDVADRSLLSLEGQQLQITVHAAKAQWNDNAVVSGAGTSLTATDGIGSGAAAVINHLPWEDTPTAYSFGTNSSTDYPDIPQQDILNEFTDGSSTTNAALPPTTTPGTTNTPPATAQNRQVNLAAVRVQVNVPKYQPANLNLYQVAGPPLGAQSQYPTSPLVGATRSDLESNTGPTDRYFPMGYVATEKITASTNGIHNPNDQNVAYRNVQVYTGVPVDIKTSMSNPVTDVGVEPAGYGTQMTGAVGPFTPYNGYAGFAGHFQPLNIVSDSNVNLINPHLDQKIVTPGAVPGQAPGLPLLSDALDSSLAAPYSYIPGYDFEGVSDLIAAQGGTNSYTLNGTNTGTALTGSGVLPQPYLIRTTLDTDVAQAYGRNPGLSVLDPLTAGSFGGSGAAAYPVVTFHKPRVGDGTGTGMTVPDVPHDNTGPFSLPVSTGQPPSPITAATPAPTYATSPYVGVAVPFGTPVGTYSQNLRLFEGYDPTYYPLVGPTYGASATSSGIGGLAPFDPNAVTTNAPNGLDTFQLNYTNGVAHAVQAYSDPATQVKVTVGEARYTNGYTAGALPMIDAGPTLVARAGAANFAPFALALPYSGSPSYPGELGLYWASSRDYVAGQPNTEYQVNAAKLNVTSNSTSTTYGAYNNQQWWEPLGTTLDLPGQPTGNNTAFSVAQTQAAFGTGYGLASSSNALYGFDTNIFVSDPLATTTLYCYPMSLLSVAGGGVPSGGVVIASSPQPKSDLHGLAMRDVPFADPNGGATINNNLWSFWTGGTRGRTAIYYSLASTGTTSLRFGTDINGSETPGHTAVLPVPAGLVAVSDPNPVLTHAPDLANNTGAPVPAIEVTYSGTGAGGSPDLFLSRYRPYRTLIGGQPDTAVTSPLSEVQLGLMPFPAVSEQLQPDTANLNTLSWWQARDVGWVRDNALSFRVSVTLANGTTTDTSTFTETGPNTYTGGYTPNGAATATAFNGQIAYDRASGVLVFTNVTLPLINGAGTAINQTPGQTVYVDVAQGRIRFSLHLPYGSPNLGAYATVSAYFSATARRITTSPAADTQPVAFLDEAYQPNSSGVVASAGVNADQNVQADRYWFVWHKSAVGGANPTLWYKTQRLTVAVTDNNGQPVTIDPTTLTVTLQPSGVSLYTHGAGANVVDVDRTRGRLYFPIVFQGANGAGSNSDTALEGQLVTITGGGPNGGNLPTTTGRIEWLDEPRYNDPIGQDTSATLEAAASDGYQIPLVTTINESGVSAFLDPGAFLNGTGNTPGSIDPSTFNVASSISAALHPHKVWLFWTSNRNGTADIYSEVLNPRFSASGDNGSP